MVKKESAKRGYMTTDEVKEHLKNKATTNTKITYLADILTQGFPDGFHNEPYFYDKSKKPFSRGTRKSIYKVLGELYEQKSKRVHSFSRIAGDSIRNHYLDKAEQCYERAGDEKEIERFKERRRKV
ncbi:hypothetical protein J4205_02740 [Candidatus Pacearchaeota archaeon]|nr:hypothetical protein [Candidatus Pacearchaeota archaeon]